jgi:uncharacterized surface protein with fasciclin (FAS1) repeats
VKFNMDIATLVTQLDELSTLAKMVGDVQLTETLKGQNPLTAFAPDNEAFKKIPVGTMDSLLKDKEKLTAVLTYHVANGKYMTADLKAAKRIKTIKGDILEVHEQHLLKHGVKVNDAEIKEANLECTNGVLHIINSVLLPK